MPAPRGGLRHKLLRQQKAEIVAYLESHSFDETMKYFHIKRAVTLDNLLKDETPNRELNFVNRLNMRIDMTDAGLSQCRSEIKRLQFEFDQFQNVVVSQVTSRFVQLVVNNLMPEVRRLTEPTTVTQQSIIDMKNDLKKAVGG